MAEKHFISFSLIVPLKCTVLGSDLVHLACKADCDLGYTQAHPSHHESDSGEKKNKKPNSLRQQDRDFYPDIPEGQSRMAALREDTDCGTHSVRFNSARAC